jgi:2-methylcitrate dehydratase
MRTSLLCRVSVKVLPAFSRRFATELPARVIVTLHDGSVVANELSDYQGFYTRPPTWDDELAKFTALTKIAWPILDRPKWRQLCTSSRH